VGKQFLLGTLALLCGFEKILTSGFGFRAAQTLQPPDSFAVRIHRGTVRLFQLLAFHALTEDRWLFHSFSSAGSCREKTHYNALGCAIVGYLTRRARPAGLGPGMQPAAVVKLFIVSCAAPHAHAMYEGTRGATRF
jgi:hypothetical protein